MAEKDRESDACKVLIIEDDEQFRRSLIQTLEIDGFAVAAYGNAQLALSTLVAGKPDVVLTDLFLGDADGLEVLARVHAADSDLPVVLMTARGNIPIAIKAVRGGAYEFLEKPFDRERLVTVLQRAGEQRRLAQENRALKERLLFTSGIDSILRGQSTSMRELRDIVLRIAPAPADVVIRGETGTGKELVAGCLHQFSGRRGHFVAINCAAIPDNLFESELFGHEAGAYTGAVKQRIGKLEYASGGTLFLDEVETMPLHLQAKVLRALQERQVERLGSNRPIAIDLRVVAATKVDLKEHSAAGKFRLDLFFRLNVVAIKIPPLRERREDIGLLFEHFLQEAALRFRQPAAEVDADTAKRLLAYDWPGNIRELRNAADQLQLGIPLSIGQEGVSSYPLSLTAILASVEKAALEQALRRHGGSVEAACRELELNSSTLYRKMKAYNMDVVRYRDLEE
jgi:two-component system C4-dicarboxylate transport response regulator DctD